MNKIFWPESTFFKRPKKGRNRPNLGKKRASPEHAIQVQVVNAFDDYWSNVPHGTKKPELLAIPNGGKRHIRTAIKLKREGVRSGAPDLLIILPGGRAAFLELKSEKGRLSKTQDDFRQRLQVLGAWWDVAHSVDEAFGILAAWGCLPSEAKR